MLGTNPEKCQNDQAKMSMTAGLGRVSREAEEDVRGGFLGQEGTRGPGGKSKQCWGWSESSGGGWRGDPAPFEVSTGPAHWPLPPTVHSWAASAGTPADTTPGCPRPTALHLSCRWELWSPLPRTSAPGSMRWVCRSGWGVKAALLLLVRGGGVRFTAPVPTPTPPCWT